MLNETSVEQATIEDLPQLTDLLYELFSHEADFRPDRDKQMRGIRLILEQPNRGRIFVIRHNGTILGMINLLFTISTAEGGIVFILEDLIIHHDYRYQGFGDRLLNYAIEYAKEKDISRITLLIDRLDEASQQFFHKHGFIDSVMIPMRLYLGSAPTGKPEVRSTCQ